MFAAVTLGVLVKGPVMLAWMLGGTLGAAVMVRSFAPLRWLAWLPGWALLLGVAAAGSCSRPAASRVSALRVPRGVLRAADHEVVPARPAPVVRAGRARGRRAAVVARYPVGAAREHRARVGLGFVLFAAVFFTASHSKLVTYLVPCLPPLAWLAAEAWSDPQRARRGAWVAVVVLAVLAIGVAIAAPERGHAETRFDLAAPHRCASRSASARPPRSRSPERAAPAAASRARGPRRRSCRSLFL